MKKTINVTKKIAEIAKIKIKILKIRKIQRKTTKAIAKTAIINNAKKIVIKEIRAEIIHLNDSSITLHVMNTMKKDINNMNVQKLQRKKKIKMQEIHSNLKTSTMFQSKRMIFLLKCFKLLKP